ncbi:unnamed protein product [Mycena citricolor]|uniref:Uncharacterized protein n=1 Tax=Mycena citricolor TaxID=2018698 RepID=A0AAD2HCH9_9AGAR|nr:unnamed protein product [Mycena citricolor]
MADSPSLVSLNRHKDSRRLESLENQVKAELLRLRVRNWKAGQASH